MLLSAILSAPWQGIAAPTYLCGLLGLGGVAYAPAVARRLHAQNAYHSEFEDWLFHAILPSAAYATLAVAAYPTLNYARVAPFGVGTAALLLLFIGIHNAWDKVTYHVLVRRQVKRDADQRPAE